MMDLRPVLVTAPAAAPLTLEEAKTHLRVDGDDEDGLVQGLVDAAIAHLDGPRGLGRCLVNQTWRQDFTCWPSDGTLRLPFPDVSSIVWVKFYDSDDAQQTVTSADYALLSDALGGYVEFVPGWSAPVLDSRPAPVGVQFVAGFGVDAEAVPADIRTAMLLMVGAWYHNREEIGPAGASLLPLGAQALLAKYRWVGV